MDFSTSMAVPAPEWLLKQKKVRKRATAPHDSPETHRATKGKRVAKAKERNDLRKHEISGNEAGSTDVSRLTKRKRVASESRGSNGISSRGLESGQRPQSRSFAGSDPGPNYDQDERPMSELWTACNTDPTEEPLGSPLEIARDTCVIPKRTSSTGAEDGPILGQGGTARADTSHPMKEATEARKLTTDEDLYSRALLDLGANHSPTLGQRRWAREVTASKVSACLRAQKRLADLLDHMRANTPSSFFYREGGRPDGRIRFQYEKRGSPTVHKIFAEMIKASWHDTERGEGIQVLATRLQYMYALAIEYIRASLEPILTELQKLIKSNSCSEVGTSIKPVSSESMRHTDSTVSPDSGESNEDIERMEHSVKRLQQDMRRAIASLKNARPWIYIQDAVKTADEDSTPKTKELKDMDPLENWAHFCAVFKRAHVEWHTETVLGPETSSRLLKQRVRTLVGTINYAQYHRVALRMNSDLNACLEDLRSSG